MAASNGNCFICGKIAIKNHVLKEHNGADRTCVYAGSVIKNSDQDMLMAITNPSRCGECGYDGDLDIWTFDSHRNIYI